MPETVRVAKPENISSGQGVRRAEHEQIPETNRISPGAPPARPDLLIWVCPAQRRASQHKSHFQINNAQDKTGSMSFLSSMRSAIIDGGGDRPCRLGRASRRRVRLPPDPKRARRDRTSTYNAAPPYRAASRYQEINVVRLVRNVCGTCQRSLRSPRALPTTAGGQQGSHNAPGHCPSNLIGRPCRKLVPTASDVLRHSQKSALDSAPASQISSLRQAPLNANGGRAPTNPVGDGELLSPGQGVASDTGETVV